MIFNKSFKNTKFYNVYFFLLVIFLSSCSLNYNSENHLTSQSPEFVFTNPKYFRINEGKLNMEITASTIEQYASDETMYAKNINFELFNNNGEKSAEGKGNLLSANLETGLYYLFDNIIIKNFEKNITITASSIKWDDESEQLTTEIKNPSESQVFITSEGDPKFKIQGYGFSGSGFDHSFTFTGEISGEITTKK